ncbi:MAG TPA: quinohemoprotein amine dehydrogenase subunit alpha [Sphingobium sp.]|uniref:quinohemoprotein amine dehydrogenase subunit alpha n=1 Tax=Sphingobium sp. TaxID=1912891 RepID=UPI002ED5854B
MTFPETNQLSADDTTRPAGVAPPGWLSCLSLSHLRKRAARRLPPRRYMLLGLCSASVIAAAQVGGMAAPGDKDDFTEAEEGIPVTDKLTQEKCGACHAPDAKGNLSRISWIRTTPEGWDQAIKRMVRLNGLSITPAESRSVIKYLATWHGLAPEEAKPVMYLTEHRIIDETNIPNEAVRGSCAACHSFAQPLSWRRSKTEWKLLQNLHVAMYSQAEAQFRHDAPPEPGAAPLAPGTKPPKQGDIGLDYITRTAPLNTPEWTAWKPRIRDPKLAGKWMISAAVPGQGRFVGEMTIQPSGAPDEFDTTTTMHSLTSGSTLTRKGHAIVYAGYSWRGRSAGATKPDAPDDVQSATRETMWFSPDQKTATGRWFWGEYQEFGYDVKLTRASAAPTVVSVTPNALKAGTRGAAVHIYGDNLPSGLATGDVDLGAGITVHKIASVNTGELIATVDVAPDATEGLRDISVQGASLEKALPIYRKVDYLKVTPETTLARLGGIKFPKGYQQFDAIGYSNGPDGKPNTPDDVSVGPIDANWSVQEFSTVFYDDDKSFVGTLSPAALFTPNVEGPNPQRRFGRNNYGEVWVVATAKTEKDPFGKPLTARSYLVVTVPMYKRIDQPEVSQ